MIDALIFDLDDTLMPERAFWNAAFDAVCGEAGLPPRAVQAAVIRSAEELWRATQWYPHCDALGLGAPSWLFSDALGEAPSIAGLLEHVPSMRRTAWEGALSALGVERGHSEALERALMAQVGQHHAACDDVLPALTRLGTYRLAVLTNGPSDLQRAKMRATGLDGRFEYVAISAEIGYGKPDPRAFEHVASSLGIDVRRCVMVGDSVRRDVVGAIAAGMRPVHLDRTATSGESIEGVTRIASLIELPNALAAP
jgi:HAD superfamily hydrolase (TIGR01549 family)